MKLDDISHVVEQHIRPNTKLYKIGQPGMDGSQARKQTLKWHEPWFCNADYLKNGSFFITK
jgi:hypothetical protein